MFYTYVWLRENGTPYYVGKGHGRRAYRKHRIGIAPPKGRILFYIAKDEADALGTEALLIWYYGRKDTGTGCLWNFTDGGENPPKQFGNTHAKGIPHPFKGKTGRFSKETLQKMSQARLGKDPWNKGVKGSIPWNKGVKGAQAAWNKGLKSSVVPWNKGKGRSLAEKRAAHNIATKKHRDKKKAQERLNEQPIRS